MCKGHELFGPVYQQQTISPCPLALTAQPRRTQRGPLFTPLTLHAHRIGSSAPSLQPYRTAAATSQRGNRALGRSDPVVAVGSVRSKSIGAPSLRAPLLAVLLRRSFLSFLVGSNDAMMSLLCWCISEQLDEAYRFSLPLWGNNWLAHLMPATALVSFSSGQQGRNISYAAVQLLF